MEDASSCGEALGDAHIFAVFDGHGGARAAKLLARQLPGALQKAHDAKRAGEHDGGLILAASAARDAFADIDGRILSQGWDDGSCACVALLSSSGRRLQLLQVGDCNAMIVSRDTAGAPTLLCRSHRPTEAAEAARLQAAGTLISATGRIGGLAVCRAFGDRELKESLPSGSLISEPEVSAHALSPVDALLILGCDGLWDYCDTESAAAIVHAALPALAADPTGRPTEGELAATARALVNAALDRGSDDNVSVIVVDVTRPAQLGVTDIS